MKLLFKKTPIRYTPLLITICALYVFSPTLIRLEGTFPVLSFFLLFAMIMTLWTINLKKGLIGGISLLTLATIFSPKYLGKVPLFEEFIFVVVWSFATVILIIRLFHETKVTVDTISGGIAIYFMGALVWALIYLILYELNPAAFSFADGIVGHGIALFYFSFTTISTLGYGDVVPRSLAALSMANLEAMTGQIFIAVLIARLVGMHISQKAQDK